MTIRHLVVVQVQVDQVAAQDQVAAHQVLVSCLLVLHQDQVQVHSVVVYRSHQVLDLQVHRVQADHLAVVQVDLVVQVVAAQIHQRVQVQAVEVVLAVEVVQGQVQVLAVVHLVDHLLVVRVHHRVQRAHLAVRVVAAVLVEHLLQHG